MATNQSCLQLIYLIEYKALISYAVCATQAITTTRLGKARVVMTKCVEV